jgi:glycosyltransferase involved in cell wall biosynthesis
MTSDTAAARDSFCIIIPAHNEESVIDRCLAFVPDLEPGEAVVIVVPNGCTDRTAELARRTETVKVVELDVPSKSAALNEGDRVAQGFPRVYLDADIVTSTATLRALADVLSTPGTLVAAPTPEFTLDGRPWIVRAFYRIYRQIPYVTDGLIGLGIYGLSSEGRARFEHFPPVTADDLFVQRLFAPTERTVLGTCSFRVETPRNLRSLIAVRTRTAFGNRELAGWSDREAVSLVDRTTDTTVVALVRMVRRNPQLLPAVAVYSAVTVIARVRARRRAAQVWQRDDTTRATLGDGLG